MILRSHELPQFFFRLKYLHFSVLLADDGGIACTSKALYMSDIDIDEVIMYKHELCTLAELI